MSVFHAQHDKDHPYTKILNILLQDRRLSYRSRGVIAYILTKPSHWKVRIKDLENNGTEGRLAIQKAMQELSVLGYAKITVLRDGSGKITGKDYYIFETPANTLASP